MNTSTEEKEKSEYVMWDEELWGCWYGPPHSIFMIDPENKESITLLKFFRALVGTRRGPSITLNLSKDGLPEDSKYLHIGSESYNDKVFVNLTDEGWKEMLNRWGCPYPYAYLAMDTEKYNEKATVLQSKLQEAAKEKGFDLEMHSRHYDSSHYYFVADNCPEGTFRKGRCFTGESDSTKEGAAENLLYMLEEEEII